MHDLLTFCSLAYFKLSNVMHKRNQSCVFIRKKCYDCWPFENVASWKANQAKHKAKIQTTMLFYTFKQISRSTHFSHIHPFLQNLLSQTNKSQTSYRSLRFNTFYALMSTLYSPFELFQIWRHYHAISYLDRTMRTQHFVLTYKTKQSQTKKCALCNTDKSWKCLTMNYTALEMLGLT